MKNGIFRLAKVVLAAVMIAAVACGCGVFSQDGAGGINIGGNTDNGSSAEKVDKSKYDDNCHIYPVYSSLTGDERDAYVRICNAMEIHDESEVPIGTYDTKSEMEEAIDWLDFTYQQIAYEHPDFFWVDPNYYTYTEMEDGNEYTLLVEISYSVSKDEYKSLKSEYDSIISDIVSGAEAQTNLFDRVLYVYDYILDNTEYDYNLAESEETSDISRSAYGCLVEGETVCSGYALAFTAVMQELGIECGSEFNTYGEFSIVSGHVWNYCKLDGEYYYFDATWDDTAFDSDDYRPYIDYGHLYFGITKDELYASHLPLDERAPTPDCNGTKYNYFVYTGANFETYDFDDVSEYIETHSDSGFVAMRFGSYSELLSAQTELLEDSRIYEILPDIEEIMYVASDANLHLILFF